MQQLDHILGCCSQACPSLSGRGHAELDRTDKMLARGNSLDSVKVVALTSLKENEKNPDYNVLAARRMMQLG